MKKKVEEGKVFTFYHMTLTGENFEEKTFEQRLYTKITIIIFPLSNQPFLPQVVRPFKKAKSTKFTKKIIDYTYRNKNSAMNDINISFTNPLQWQNSNFQMYVKPLKIAKFYKVLWNHLFLFFTLSLTRDRWEKNIMVRMEVKTRNCPNKESGTWWIKPHHVFLRFFTFASMIYLY